MGFPLELLFGASCPTQPSNADDGEQLFEGSAGAPDQVFEVAVRTMGVSLSFYGCRCGALHAFDEVEPQCDGAVFGGVFRGVPPGIDAGCCDAATEEPRFMDVELRAVEAPEIVDAGGHVFEGPVGLDEEALVAFNGE